MSFEQLAKLENPSEQEKVVISRFWNHPEITITINRDRINVITDIDSFLTAMLTELEDPAMMFEKKRDEGKSAWLWIRSLYPKSVAIDHDQLKMNIHAAAKRAIEKLKEATCQVM